MNGFGVLRYWFLYGNFEAYMTGEEIARERCPISCTGKGAFAAFEAGILACKAGRVYRQHFRRF